MDNNYFGGVRYSSRLTLTDGSAGKLTGLVDHNVLYYTAPSYGNNSYQNSYRGSSSTCYGFDSLKRPLGFGTDDFVFWESNYLHNSFLETSDGGGRVVVRYNEIVSTFTDGSMLVLDGHGADTAGHHACGVVANEFYRNSISGPAAFAQIVDMRGGAWRVHNNTLPASGILQLNEYRAMGMPYCSSTYLDWNSCSGGACCAAAFKQCPTAADVGSAYPLPNQIHDTVVWNNTRNGANVLPIVLSTGYVRSYIVVNRDYWVAESGPDSQQESCTAGAFYGSTESGRLWRCSTAGTWALYYAPYTFPHPLGAPEASGRPSIIR